MLPRPAMNDPLSDLIENGFDEETFLKFSREKWESFAVLGRDFPTDGGGDFEDAKILGVIEEMPLSGGNASANSPVLVCSARLPAGKELGERSSRRRQFDFARKILRDPRKTQLTSAAGTIYSGIFAFSDDAGNFRLSLVSGTPNARGGIEWSSFKRRSFYIKAETESATFRRQLSADLSSIENLKSAFSVEKLTREFYARIEKWFCAARERVEFPGARHLGISAAEHNSMMTLRLITRLIFIWFLKQKDLVPAELFEETEIKNLLNFEDKRKSTYYKAILQNLFFATLNTPREKRRWLEDSAFRGTNKNRGEQEFFRYYTYFKDAPAREKFFKLCQEIPFVNGGLFENLDGNKDDDTKQKDEAKRIDCFSQNAKNLSRLHVPDALFFDKETGLLDILKQYNFTVEENSPSDEDVALDPELLGRVFENLLAYVVPETQEQARKSSGSFYTPREIVNYMVDESLKSYLSRRLSSYTPPLPYFLSLKISKNFSRRKANKRSRAHFPTRLSKLSTL